MNALLMRTIPLKVVDLYLGSCDHLLSVRRHALRLIAVDPGTPPRVLSPASHNDILVRGNSMYCDAIGFVKNIDVFPNPKFLLIHFWSFLSLQRLTCESGCYLLTQNSLGF